MKVVGYVHILKTGYLHIHNIGVVIEGRESPRAVSLSTPLPAIGTIITDTFRTYNLFRGFDEYVPVPKLVKYLYGIE